MRWPVLVSIAAVHFLLARPAAAQWPPDGLAVCGTECVAYRPMILPDGTGGAFLAWIDLRSSSQTESDVYAQRITAEGKIAPGWPLGGLAVCTLPKQQEIEAIASDGQGGLLLVWVDFRNSETTSEDAYAQRIMADGTIAPGWPVNGTPVSRALDFQSCPAITSDGQGGAYVAWEDWRDYSLLQETNVYAQHLTATGAVAENWQADGLPVCTLNSGSTVGALSDGAGGMIAVWTDARRGGVQGGGLDVYAQRLHADGTRAPGWLQNGMKVAPDRGASTQLVFDGAGGFYVGCILFDSGFLEEVEYTAQRFMLTGSIAPGWPAAGAPVCRAPGVRQNLQLASDGLGGLLLAWYDYRTPLGGSDIYAARMLPNGTRAPDWTLDGTLVSDPTQGLEFEVNIAPDGLGGAYVAWEWETNFGRPSRIQHLNANGAVATGWPQYGFRVAGTTSQFTPRLATDGAGGVTVAWEEGGVGGLVGIYAKRFNIDGPVPALLSLVDAQATEAGVVLSWFGVGAENLITSVERRTAESGWVTLGPATAQGPGSLRYEDRTVVPGSRYAYRLAYQREGAAQVTPETWVDVPGLALSLAGFQPNPARGRALVRLTLPNATPATLEALDVRGRILGSRAVGSLGPGTHAVELDTFGPLRPGIYWLRLTQAGHVVTAKGIVLP